MGDSNMPQVFKIGSYWVYFWTNEGDPLEPVHVHVSEGCPTAQSTKNWITKAGKTYLCNKQLAHSRSHASQHHAHYRSAFC